MITDEVNQADENEMIEILVDNMWIPAMATDLRIMNKEADLVEVKAIRVRKLEV